jgi:acetyltransferase-like isoleucine patch superfamily enzyme
MFARPAALRAHDQPPLGALDIEALAARLAPLVAQKLLAMPTVWGDPARIHTAENVVLLNTLFNTSSGEIHVGRDSFFSHNVSLITGSHPVEARGAARHAFAAEGGDIRIGAGVWVASNAVILGPCSVGNHAVIAAGAVLLPGDYAGAGVYGGVPARLLRKLADADPVA